MESEHDSHVSTKRACAQSVKMSTTQTGKMNRGGFDYTFIKPPPKRLECPVCLLVLKEPHVSSCCGNHFCRACIQRIQIDTKPCPLCQDTDFSVMLHKGVMREVNSLEIKCPNEGVGCPWKGELGTLGDHINGGPRVKDGGCGYVEIQCVYGCGCYLQRRILQEHQEEICPKRPVEVQLSSSLRKIKGVIEENDKLKVEVSKLKDKVSSFEEENSSLKSRIAKLERNEKQKASLGSNQEVEILKFELKELQTTQTRQASKSNQELQSIKKDIEQFKIEQKAKVLELLLKIPPTSHVRQIPAKPIDPLNVVMVEDLKTKGILKTERVEETMKAIDRKHYAPANHYVDSPQSIGHNTSISAPHMHAHTLELLKDVLKDGATVLDVGSGSGYLTAYMAYMSAPSGYAVGIDRVRELTVQATNNIKNDNPELLRYNVFMVTGDGHDGYEAKAPYDVIHVGGATPTVPPSLYDQLKCGGRMIIPVGPQGGNQYLEQHDKKMDGSIVRKKLMGVRYGPLLKF